MELDLVDTVLQMKSSVQNHLYHESIVKSLILVEISI